MNKKERLKQQLSAKIDKLPEVNKKIMMVWVRRC